MWYDSWTIEPMLCHPERMTSFADGDRTEFDGEDAILLR